MNTLRYGAFNEDVRALQKTLRFVTGADVSLDAQFGPGTERLLRSWQESAGVRERDAQDRAFFGPLSFNQLGQVMTQGYVTEGLYQEQANAWGVEVAALKAFAITESKGSGFLANGFPVILFERHKFFQALSQAYDSKFANEIARKNPDICNPNSGGYVGYSGELPRLERAAAIDWECAHSSASWGAFQLMGFNYDICGFASVAEMIDAMKANEVEHFYGFVNFCEANRNILPALRRRDWNVVALSYNGSAALRHGYHVKMADNYKLALRQRA